MKKLSTVEWKEQYRKMHDVGGEDNFGVQPMILMPGDLGKVDDEWGLCWGAEGTTIEGPFKTETEAFERLREVERTLGVKLHREEEWLTVGEWEEQYARCGGTIEVHQDGLGMWGITTESKELLEGDFSSRGNVLQRVNDIEVLLGKTFKVKE